MGCFEAEGDTLFWIVTVDEACVLHFELERKRQSMVPSSVSPEEKVPKVSISRQC